MAEGQEVDSNNILLTPPEVEKDISGKILARLIGGARTFGYTTTEILLGIAQEDFLSTITQAEPKVEPPKNLNMRLYGDQELLGLLSGKVEMSDRKLWLVFASGGQRAVITAGILTGMQKAGLIIDQNIAGVVGVSAGATNILGLWGKNMEAAEIYFDEHVGPNGFYRIPEGGIAKMKLLYKILTEGAVRHPILDTRIAAEVMKSGKRPIDVEAIRNSVIEQLLILTMDAETGEQCFLDVKDPSIDPIFAMDAAITVPGASFQRHREINGRNLCDGAYSRQPIPLDEIFRRGATDVIIFGNTSIGEVGGSVGTSIGVLDEVAVFAQASIAKNSYGYPPEVVAQMMAHREISRQTNHDLNRLITRQDPDRRVLLMVPEENILSKVDQRSGVIKEMFRQATVFGGVDLKKRTEELEPKSVLV